MNIITSYDINEVYSRIKIKKPIKFNNKIILNLYDEYQDCLLFQSPTMYLPYDYIYNDNVIKCMDLCEYNDNKFINFITILYKKIITKIETFDKKLFENKEFFSNIIKKNEKFIMFRLKEVYFSRLNVYDTNNTPININKIVKETKIKCIFMIKNIWINDDKYGFNLQLLQIQYKDFLNNENLFKNSSNSDNEWTNVIIEKDIPPPPPPPPAPPPPCFPNSQNTGKPQNINEIIKERKKNNKKNNKKEITTPTMADVLSQLTSGQIKLKPTIINEKSNKDALMSEMEQILKRRMSLINGQ